MILFWVAAAILSAGAAFIILSRAAGAPPQAADPTAGLYRRQLSEIDELAERGLIGEAERSSAQAEAARRLLAASDAPAGAWSAGAGARPWVLASAIAAPALAVAVYLLLGAPGVRDQPFSARMQTWMRSDPGSLNPPELAAVLHRMTRERPNDPEGFRYLALAEGASQNPAEAVRALRRAVKLAPGRADLWEMLGEAQVVESQGPVTPDAQAAFEQAVKLDPKAMVARFHLARARFEAGDKAQAQAQWQAILADLPPGDPRRSGLAAAIAQAQGAPPPAAQQAAPPLPMSAIRAMVDRLAARLKTNPDDPDGWVRLVRAYAVLGDAPRRDGALKQAQARYAARPEVLTALRQAASAEPMR